MACGGPMGTRTEQWLPNMTLTSKDISIKSVSSQLYLCTAVPDATSLHHCLKNKQLKLIILWFPW